MAPPSMQVQHQSPPGLRLQQLYLNDKDKHCHCPAGQAFLLHKQSTSLSSGREVGLSTYCTELHCCHPGLRKASERLGRANKGINRLTRELEQGGLQRRLNGGETPRTGRQRSPYSPWLAQPYLKVSTCVHSRPGLLVSTRKHTKHSCCFYMAMTHCF